MAHPSTATPSRKAAAWGLILCLGLPFVLRLLLSWCFYGSTDTQNYLSAMEELLKGADNLFNYYTPSFFPEALGAMGGLATGLPMTAVFKMSHAIPDLILAGWFYAKLVRANDGRASLRIYLLTFLLQLAPGIVLISHIHGQMDSWSILFTVMAVEFFVRERPAWAFVAGLAMIFGTGIKIFPLFLIPCFYLHRPWRLRHLAMFTAGLAAGFGIYFSQRFSNPHLVWVITTGALGYESQALMGIKGIIWPYLQKLPGGAPSLRVFVIGGLALAYLFSWVRRLDLHRSILLALLAVMTVSFHMAPQYLLWPCFLLFLVGMYRTAVFYNLGAGALLIVYYYYTRDNSGAYAPLVSMDALAPIRPHWLDEPYPLQIFNDRLRGEGIWWTIALSLLSLVVVTLWQQKKHGLASLEEPANRRLFAPDWSWRTGVAVLVAGYLLTLLFTWPSPFRRALGRQLDTDYYQTNYFSYGADYLYEVTIPPSVAGSPGPDSVQFTFSGNDFYAVFQNGAPFDGPFVGRAYPGHHGGVFGYHQKTHTVRLPAGPARMADGSFKFWILDGNGSIDAYRLPRFALTVSGVAVEPAGLRIGGARLNSRQVARVFAVWREHGMLPANLGEILGVSADLRPDTGSDDGALPPPMAPPDDGIFYFSIIEGLWIYLGIWVILGLIPSLWNLRASNT